MANSTITADTVELDATEGVAFIEQASPLTRLHYFDGKFLRADALALEQDYHRHRTRLSNIASGWGAVHGLGISLSGNQLNVGAGLAITAAGNFVLAIGELHASIDDLLKVAAPEPPAGSPSFADCLEAPPSGVKETAALAIYEITVGPVEGLCGNEPVYGKLCETACASDSRHPFWREGVVLRLRPITLQLPASTSVMATLAHLRNRIASAYFRAEPWLTPSAVSGAGLASGVWCEPAALYGRDEVVIGLLAREGGVNRVIDAWSGRRERMDTQPRSYWQGRMAMRPWNVFVAQILQFQCQLSGLFVPGKPVIEPADDCDQLRDLIEKTRKELEALLGRYGASTKKILQRAEGRPTAKEMKFVADDVVASFADLDGLSSKLAEVELGKGALPKQRMLLNAGFFELPPAGYLPLDPQAAVEDQVQRMFGEGVRLHYHAVHSDEIAHLVEEAQHMERISLTRGLDDPKNLEQVEIFVPDGQVRGVQPASTGTWWRLDMNFAAFQAFSFARKSQKFVTEQLAAHDAEAAPARSQERSKSKAARAELAEETIDVLVQVKRVPTLDGLVRTEGREDGSYGFALVAATDPLQDEGKNTLATIYTRAGRLALYVSADIVTDPFALPVGGEAAVKAEIRAMVATRGTDIQSAGTLTVLDQRALSTGRQQRLVQLDLQSTERTIDTEPASSANRVRLILQRDGDVDSGIFIIDDERHDPASSPIIFEWDEAPRRAAMFVETEDAAGALARHFEALAAVAPPPPPPPPAPPPTPAPAPAPAPTPVRQQVLGMSALPAMPDPTSAVGVAAMNTLVALADATDDAAFLMRARRRLFPTLDAPKTQTVRAIRDWVMFRRARTHLSGPICDVLVPAGLEAFQVWHLKVDSKEELVKLKEALEKHDEKALAAFAFKRVGILRYGDESAYSEESADRVVAMWADAEPGPQVVLGRVWESAPTTGQGWQNHFRLRNMLEQIATLTKPPPRGRGELAAISVPPSPLADSALDGGMLVVTTGEVQSRKALLIYGGYDTGQSGDQHFLNNEFPRSDLSFENDAPKGEALMNFVKGLTNQQPVNGITLATTKAAPDDTAKVRLQAVVTAVTAAGRPAPLQSRQKVSQLNKHDHDELIRIGLTPEDYDEIIFFELNAGDRISRQRRRR